MTAKKGPIGLKRMRRLLELLGNPEKELKVIHVAGTNGKGSVCQFMASMLRAAGYSVGVFTSPHVMEYNERFDIDRQYISDDDFCRIATYVMSFAEQVNDEGFGYFSEFEILTSTALMYFKEQSPDIVILETGIGGKMDMTNVISNPLVSVITQIGFDHVDMLGDTLTEIIEAKAGIIKEGIPVVSESPEPEVKKVISDTAKEKNAKFIDASLAEYKINDYSELMSFDFEFTEGHDEVKMDGVKIGLIGEHQIRNAITALLAVRCIRNRGSIAIDDSEIRQGLENARNMGRFEILRSNPYIVIDGSHNPQGLTAAMATLKELRETIFKDKRILTVFGCFADKEYQTMTEILKSGLATAYCHEVIATEPVSPRALKAEELKTLLEDESIAVTAISDEETAFDRALASGADVLLFLGSIYLIGDIRIFFNRKDGKINV
ncbi:hypothetical protein AXF17_07250 [Mogibacterium pumilum]|uniref:tetrahydrofolate synthase n=2 Tax=Mogibacterium pumilum TaxID=86332 RepID=A0A223AUB6_9FIRM|nr:hypothetical protein AXF17_07250 [Mogibacterium pumilum]